MSVNINYPCGQSRRLLAIIYDLILLFSILIIATMIILPFTGGMAIKNDNLIYSGYLLLCSYLYFVWQWAYGGQTLGMQAWRIRLLNFDEKPVNWMVASKRFLFAIFSWLIFGAGFFLWTIFDRDRLTFHDRYSKTFLSIIQPDD